MALRPEKTLGELRDQLASRLGFGAQIGNLGAQDTILRGFLDDAQRELWWQFDWPQIHKRTTRTTGVNQEVYDYPDGCAPSGITTMWARRPAGRWVLLTEGIGPLQDTATSFVGDQIPRRYAREAQLRVWPIPQEALELRFEYTLEPTRFTQDSDRCTLPDAPVFLHALACAKRHYRQPDAEAVEKRLGALIGKIRMAEHGNTRYNARSGADSQTHDWTGPYSWLWMDPVFAPAIAPVVTP